MDTRPEPRIPYTSLAPATKALHTLHDAVNRSRLDQRIVELVRIRASQLNRCAFCLDMHTRDAVAAGETARRLALLAGWQEAPVFDARERAALALTEAVTTLADGVPDVVLEACEAVFAPEELSALLFAIVEINAWNRLNVAARKPVDVAVGA